MTELISIDLLLFLKSSSVDDVPYLSLRSKWKVLRIEDGEELADQKKITFYDGDDGFGNLNLEENLIGCCWIRAIFQMEIISYLAHLKFR